MKIGTAAIDGRERVVVLLDDPGDLAVLLPATLPGVGELAADWPRWRPRVEEAVERAGAEGVAAEPMDDLTWLPPVPRPGKVVCVALNNSANKDRIMSGPEHPATFPKPTTSLVGHQQPIRIRPEYGRVHPEPELAVVIGRGGRDIAREDALDHVFGYTIINDLTSPTMRAEDTFHYRAIHPDPERPGDATAIRYVDTWVSYPGRYKGADTFGPIGPWIVTRDEVPDPHDLTIQCTHQGRVVTKDSTANLKHKVADVLSFLSSYSTLEPGDIIAMGTALKPSGAGSAVQNVDLATLGGPISVSITGIGELSNPVELG
ncbi:fumarylacetoacetate hydrolase family protein [Nocardioides sp. DS6]|uniref:Fumarylacetoacetate hydrolase family protein n=1 Tax=Nocardioides eburneus TaxID=3231482 RepID=A0ABV3SZJ3_9ACTN